MEKMCYRCLQETIKKGRCTACGAPEVSRSENDSELLPLGTLLDDGSIIVGDCLGRGGFGSTYIARDLKNKTLIALKEFAPRHMMLERQGLDIRIMPDKQQVYEKSLASFRRESKLLGKLNHPNIVRVYFDMDENNTAYYGMELLQGKDLRQWTDGRLPLQPQEAFDLLYPVMDALNYLHKEKNTLHRDISPDNIFIRTGDQYPGGISPCLIDFGAAYTAMNDFTQSAPGVKKSGFSPLEQNWDRSLQGSYTDVYAFGATFYYLITGQIPPPSTDRRQDNDILKAPSSFNPGISPELDRAVLHSMALRPQDRVQNMKQFIYEVGAALNAEKGPAVMDDSKVIGGEDEPPRRKDGKRETAHLLASAVDWALFYLLPTLLLSAVSPVLGIVLGFILMTGVGIICCSLPGCATPGQRLMKIRLVGLYSIGNLICYSLLRALVPLALADEIAAMIQGSRRSRIEQMTRIAAISTHGLAQDIPHPPIGHRSVWAIENQASLYCLSGLMKGKSIVLIRMHVFGRDSDQATFLFPSADLSISHRHCMIFFQDGGWYIKDLGSRNGTFVNGKRLGEGQTSDRLNSGDQIRIGEEILVFKLS
ncbi:MAG: FHA domain-containing protein [Clostridia bacterium]|nr:FHA domain-containing protein [Clostridia bacterium]